LAYPKTICENLCTLWINRFLYLDLLENPTPNTSLPACAGDYGTEESAVAGVG
jgi:hypothetical protein